MALIVAQAQSAQIAVIGSAAPHTTTKKDVIRAELDMELAAQLYRYFYEKDELLNGCREHRYANTFWGEMWVEWGSADIDPVRLDHAGERDDLESFLRQALDYRDMFGMAPLHVRRRAKRNLNKPMFSIPPFGSGKFVMEYNQRTMDTIVLYEVELPGAQASKVKRLDVFVWPGSEPVRAHGTPNRARFRSKIIALMARYLRITQLRKNLLDADHAASHPLMVTQSRPDKRNIDEQTEGELLGLAGDPSTMGPTEKIRYTRNTHRSLQMEDMVASQNASHVEGTDMPAGQHETIDPASNRAVPHARSIMNGIRHIWLPHDEELGRPVPVSSRTDFQAIESKYEQRVCETMGIPEAYITGTGGARIKGETDQMQQIVRTTVQQDRKDVNLFYPWAYERAHRGHDNSEMINALLQVDENEARDIGAEERARLANIRANIERISSMPNRTRVVFAQEPLQKKVEIPMLAAAVAAGAVTKLELSNLIRAELGITSIDADHDLMRKDKNAASSAPDPTLMLVPTAKQQGPGGGGGATASKRKSAGSKPKKRRATANGDADADKAAKRARKDKD